MPKNKDQFFSSTQFPNSIRDAIHGTIHLSNEEIEIIDHKLFQRLQHIKQNGPLYLVFPSATQTRFQHSLGVLHIADSAFRSLLRNTRVADQKSSSPILKYNNAEPGEAVKLLDYLDSSTLEDLLRLTRLAALVHDIGHGPYSHNFEDFAPHKEDVAKYIDNKVIFLDSLSEAIKNGDVNKDSMSVRHEVMSCVLFAKIWEDIIDKNDITDGALFSKSEVPSLITSIILGYHDTFSRSSEIKKFIPLLNDFISSAPVDADRMDYLERDSRSAGVTYGLYDRERILKSFLAYKGSPKKESKNENVLRLGIKRSGLRAVENFMQARFELYVQVYFHKTNRAVQLMLKEAANAAGDHTLFSTTASDIKEFYLGLTDRRFIRALLGNSKEYDIEELNNTNKIRNIARNIEDRNIWKRVYQGRESEVEKVFEELDVDDPIRKDSVFAKPTKDIRVGVRILKRNEDNNYHTDERSIWFDESPIMKGLEDHAQEIYRIYYEGDNSSKKSAIRRRVRFEDKKLL